MATPCPTSLCTNGRDETGRFSSTRIVKTARASRSGQGEWTALMASTYSYSWAPRNTEKTKGVVRVGVIGMFVQHADVVKGFTLPTRKLSRTTVLALLPAALLHFETAAHGEKRSKHKRHCTIY